MLHCMNSVSQVGIHSGARLNQGLLTTYFFKLVTSEYITPEYVCNIHSYWDKVYFYFFDFIACLVLRGFDRC